MTSPFSNLNLFKFVSYPLTKSDPSKFQAMHFTFGTSGEIERHEILITVTIAKEEENYE
jgi:hypothetical protein